MKKIDNIIDSINNSKLKIIIDKTVSGLMHECEKNNFNSDNVKECYNIFEDFCNSLNKTDKEITKDKLLVTGSVLAEDTIKNIDNFDLSCHKIKTLIFSAFKTSLMINEKDFMIYLLQSIYMSGAICKMYIDRVDNQNTNNLDFDEVEKNYKTKDNL